MTIPSSPKTMILCYEDRLGWTRKSEIPLAAEAARCLAPQADVELATELVSANGMTPVHLPLISSSRQEIISILNNYPASMLWNITDGLTVFCGSLIPSLGKILKIPSLGSDTYIQGLCQNKHHWRSVLESYGICCLPGVVIRKCSDTELERVGELTPPLFVKAATYGNNTGFAVVEPLAKFHEDAFIKARQLLDGGLGPVLVEEYAAGREYSVWCFEIGGWNAVVYEKIMDTPYLTTAIKDKKTTAEHYRLELRQEKSIAALALKIVTTLGIHDYVRLDIREDEKGVAYPLDINTGAFLVGRSFEMACSTLRGTPQSMFQALVISSWQRQLTQWRMD